MLLGDLALHIDLCEFDSFLFLQLEFEFLVILTSFFEELHGCSLLLDTCSFCLELELVDFRFCGALLLGSVCFGYHDLSLSETWCSGFLGSCFSEHLLSRGLFLSSGLLSLCSDDNFLSVELCSLLVSFCSFNSLVEFLISVELCSFLGGFGTFDLLDEHFLSLSFCEGDFHLLLTISTSKGFGVFDLLLLDDHGLFNGDTLFDDVLDFLTLNFEGFFFFDVLEFSDALALDGLEFLVTLHTLDFYGVGAFFVTLGDKNLALFVFL